MQEQKDGFVFWKIEVREEELGAMVDDDGEE